MSQQSDGRLPTAEVRPVPTYLPNRIEELYEGEAGFSGEQLRQYYKVVSKYRTLIVCCTLAALLLALIYVFTVTPRYTASSTVRISSYEPVLLATNIEQMLQQKSQEGAYLETQIQEIKSLSVADRVLSDEKIRQGLLRQSSKGWFSFLFGKSKEEHEDVAASAGYKNSITQIKDYLERISVKPLRRTSLVVIEAIDQDPRFAADMANKHAQEYINWVRDVRVQRQSQGLVFLQQQANDLRTKLSDLEREMADYAEENSIVALNKDENIVVQSMSQLNERHTAATSKRITAENLYREAAAALENGNAAFDDHTLQSMRSQYATLEAEYSQLSAKFTPSYPRMKQLRSQLDGLKKSMKSHHAQIVMGLKAKAMAAAEEEKNVAEQLEQQKSRAFELSKKQVNYNVLNREAESARELLQNVLRQIRETGVAVESNASNVSIVDFAAAPLYPSFPRKRLIVLVCGILGLSAGVMFAFLLNHMDNTVHTPDQIVEVIKLPSLGVVPSYAIDNVVDYHIAAEQRNINGSGAEASEAPSRESALTTGEGSVGRSRDLIKSENLPFEQIVFFKNPRAMISEAYRTIRTGILLSQAGEPPRTILVTSAQSSEGKTTLCANLAASLASAGGRVVLIDGDLRRPSIWRYFNIPRESTGLVEVITGQATFDQVAVRDAVKRITVVPSGRIPPNPAELLGSLEMVRLMDTLSAEYDYVLIDSPPVLPVTDSVILSRYVDGVVMVVKGGATPRQVVIDAKSRLLDVGARILGAVLNDIDVTRNDYSYYSRYYYAYYRNEGDEKEHEAFPGWLQNRLKRKNTGVS
ncbi:MAG: polysaccharide biosynthesis tyrosine autokinase [Deltaproteobacteria bacterium]|nr:polysaccharide biosynthesis tyrosine autokinase [Deltaproteobacteria bacterium]